MDFMIGKLTSLLDKYAGKINIPVIPWEKLNQMMDVINPYLAQANVMFPVDTLLQVTIIYMGIRAVLILIWTVSFVRRLLPF